MTSNRLKELGNFLRTRREKLDPKLFGFENGSRRRTPGLRREEVAQLAHISITLYTKLEQGRDISVSINILEGIAEALNFSQAERMHLMTLSGKLPKVERAPSPSQIDKSYQMILEGMGKYPAYIIDPMWTVVAWNQQAASLFGDFSQMSEDDRNIIWRTFTDETCKKQFVNWAEIGQKMIADFRSCYGRNIDEATFRKFVDRLSDESPEFKKMWAKYDVHTMTVNKKEIDHPLYGHLKLKHSSFAINGMKGYTMNVYVPDNSSYTEAVMDRMVSLNEEYPYLKRVN